jgi:hypothetical protein
MICCPVTGKKIPVGDVDPITFEGAADAISTVYCPYCRTNHQWSRVDAWFDFED